MSTLRLDKLIAQTLPCTRNDAGRLVRRGHVTVDGVLEHDAGRRVDPAREVVLVDDRPLPAPGPVVLMLHKPPGVVSATEDDEEATVLALVPDGLQRKGLAPIGRLDKDTTGLLLLTDDGQLSHALTHPKRHVAKVYELTFEGELAADAVARAAAGVELRDGTTCLPAELVLTAPGQATLTLCEGKYHQVKRMVAALGGRVTALHRSRFGPLALPADLPPGGVRQLTPDEVAALRSTTKVVD